MQLMEKLKLFLQESRQEFKRVNWPTWRETVKLTFVVISLSAGLAVFLGLVDYGLGRLLRLVI